MNFKINKLKFEVSFLIGILGFIIRRMIIGDKSGTEFMCSSGNNIASFIPCTYWEVYVFSYIAYFITFFLITYFIYSLFQKSS